MTALAWEVLDTGHCWNLAALAERGGPWRPVAFPAQVVLVHHPDAGPVLVDTGYAARVRTAMLRWPGLLYGLATPVSYDAGASAAEQLVARGTEPAEVRHVVLTHLHADHVGGLRDFPNAAVHLHPAALALAGRARGLGAVRRAILPELLPPDLAARAVVARFAAPSPDTAPFPGVADLLGDGTLRAVPLPGHARGHLGVLLRDATGPVLVAGDAAWSARSLTGGTGPHPVATAIFDAPARARASAAAVRTWAARTPGAHVVLAHDATTARRPASNPGNRGR